MSGIRIVWCIICAELMYITVLIESIPIPSFGITLNIPTHVENLLIEGIAYTV